MCVFVCVCVCACACVRVSQEVPDGSNMAEGEAVIITGLAPVVSVCQPVWMRLCWCVKECVCVLESEREKERFDG